MIRLLRIFYRLHRKMHRMTASNLLIALPINRLRLCNKHVIFNLSTRLLRKIYRWHRKILRITASNYRLLRQLIDFDCTTNL